MTYTYIVFGEIPQLAVSVTKDGYMGLMIYIMDRKVARMAQRNVQ